MGVFGGLKKAAAAVQEKAKEIPRDPNELKKTIGQAAEAVQERTKNIDIHDVKGLAQKGTDAIAAARVRRADTKNAVESALSEESDNGAAVSAETALKLIYLLMAVDGKILPEEETKFDEIGRELDPGYDDQCTKLMEQCKSYIGDPEDDDYLDELRFSAKDIVSDAKNEADKTISAKLLVWDLLAVAFSDGECAEEERKLIRYIARLLSVDRAIPLEMEQTVQTMMAIEAEESWIKQSNRSYNIAEVQVNELKDRKAAILQGVYALMAD